MNYFKSKLFLLPILLLSILSCDNEPLPEDFDTFDPGTIFAEPADLIGDWKLTVEDLTLEEEILVAVDTFETRKETLSYIPTSGNIFVTFNEGFTFTSDSLATFTRTITQDDDEPITEDIEKGFYAGSAGTWALEPGILTLTSQVGVSTPFFITQLTTGENGTISLVYQFDPETFIENPDDFIFPVFGLDKKATLTISLMRTTPEEVVDPTCFICDDTMNVTEYCENEDGTVSATANGQTVANFDTDGLTFEQFIASLINLGVSCQ